MALAHWYASADLFAFPSLTETFGNVVLEAQASGLAVVAFDGPALRERVSQGRDGLLVSSAEDMTEALRLLCRDPDYRRRLAAAARRTAEGQDWTPIFDALEQRYGEVVRTWSGRCPRPRPSLPPPGVRAGPVASLR
jgi:glycosyltransferase involved in cell wall biosynthesis